jgi:nucleotide-binding universal stress UspA family protein
MDIAKVLVPVTGGGRDESLLLYAIEAAKPFNAHVMAYFVRPDLAEALAFFSDGASGVVVDEIVRATRDAGDEAARRVEAAITAACSGAGVTRVDAPLRRNAVTLSLREVQGNIGDQLALEARLSDLVVFGPIRESDQAGLAEAFVQVLVETDRPVLRATDDVPLRFAERIAIGWDGKKAASQAVSAAMPFLKRAAQVEVFSIQRPPLTPDATEGLREYLALHGVTATERLIDAGNKRIGEALLQAAKQDNTDLLVMGGYGRGRLRESLIGGVTRHLIAHADIAVFMVH